MCDSDFFFFENTFAISVSSKVDNKDTAECDLLLEGSRDRIVSAILAKMEEHKELKDFMTFLSHKVLKHA